MRILTGTIKRWSFKQRLIEMQKRLRNVENFVNTSKDIHVDAREDMFEAMRILEYWVGHMKGETETPKKMKNMKKINLW